MIDERIDRELTEHEKWMLETMRKTLLDETEKNEAKGKVEYASIEVKQLFNSVFDKFGRIGK